MFSKKNIWSDLLEIILYNFATTSESLFLQLQKSTRKAE